MHSPPPCFSVHGYYPSPPAASRKFPHRTHSFPERLDDDKITKMCKKETVRTSFYAFSHCVGCVKTDHENRVGGERKERERESWWEVLSLVGILNCERLCK